MATITALPAGGNWNATGTWDTNTIPTQTDDVIIDINSGNVNIPTAYPATCRSLNMTGFTGTLTFTGTGNLTSNLKDADGYSLRIPPNSLIGTNIVIYAYSNTDSMIAIESPITTLRTSNGTHTLMAPLVATNHIEMLGGAFHSGDQDITAGYIGILAGNCEVYLGTSTVRLHTPSVGGQYFQWNSYTGGSLAGYSATIILSNTTGASKRLIGNAYPVGRAFGTLILEEPTVGGSYNLDNASLIKHLIIKGDLAPNTILLSTGQSVGITNLSALGTVDNRITMSVVGWAGEVNSSTARVYSSMSNPVVEMDYCDIYAIKTDITESPTHTWYAGSNSTTSLYATGWILSDEPSPNLSMDGGMLGIVA